MKSNVIYLTDSQWDIRMKTIATKRLRKFRSALTATSMGRYFSNAAIIEIRDGVLVVDEAVYKRLRRLWLDNSDEQLKASCVIGTGK